MPPLGINRSLNSNKHVCEFRSKNCPIRIPSVIPQGSGFIHRPRLQTIFILCVTIFPVCVWNKQLLHIVSPFFFIFPVRSWATLFRFCFARSTLEPRTRTGTWTISVACAATPSSPGGSTCLGMDSHIASHVTKNNSK